MRPASLRGRLTWGVLALLSVILGLLFTAVDLALATRLHADARTRLTDRVALATQLQDRLSAQQLVDRLRGDGVVARLCVRDGSSCVSAAADPAPPPGRPGPGPKPKAAAKVPVETAGSVLFVRAALRGDQVLTLSLDTTQITEALHRLVLLEVGGGVLALAVAGVAAARIARTALRPLADMTTLARRIAAGDRGRRLGPPRETAQRPGGPARETAQRPGGPARETAQRPGGPEQEGAQRTGGPGQEGAHRSGRPGAPGPGRRATRAEDTELAQTAAAFDAMLDELEAALERANAAEIRMRSFLSDASHELRTPLAGMQANAELLLREDPGRAERERIAVAMVREARRSARLVGDLLAMARLGEGVSLVVERVNLRTLAEAEVSRARILSPGLTFEVTGDGEPVTDGDPVRLGQIITNLLDNARHATPGGGTVTVDVRHRGGRIRLEVSDTGPGVAEADRAVIFERFGRGDASRSRHTGGAGLGLPIARGLARAHGGELVHVAGARFRLELPAPLSVAGSSPG